MIFVNQVTRLIRWQLFFPQFLLIDSDLENRSIRQSKEQSEQSQSDTLPGPPRLRAALAPRHLVPAFPAETLWLWM